MTIKIFPNEQVIQEFPKEKDRLLNLNLLGILESMFGIAKRILEQDNFNSFDKYICIE